MQSPFADVTRRQAYDPTRYTNIIGSTPASPSLSPSLVDELLGIRCVTKGALVPHH
jgi:hypothetical protein